MARLGMIAACVSVLACETAAAPHGPHAASGASALPTTRPYLGPALEQSGQTTAARSTATPVASAPAPLPSVVVGKAACDGCLEAERAGNYLTPQGVGHYLVGCDDDAIRQQCLAAARRSLPSRVRELVARRECGEARRLEEFAQRNDIHSRALEAAFGKCRAR